MKIKSLKHLPLMALFGLITGVPNIQAADDAAFDACSLAISEASMACTTATMISTAEASYSSGMNGVCDLNYHALENVNISLCFLQYQLDFDGSATGAATIGSSEYTWTYTNAITESFATVAGYDQKIIVTKDGIVQMVMWWQGLGDDTKGYMISNKVGVEVSNELTIYIQWDKTTAAQWVRYERGTWDSVVNSDGPMDVNGGQINRGKYGYLSIDTGTDEVNDLEIIDVVGNATDNTLVCKRNRAWGMLASFIIFVSDESALANSTVLDETDVSGYLYNSSGELAGVITDLITSAMGMVNGPGDFARSCNDIYEGRDGGTSGIYAANTDGVRLDFEKTPELVFGSASP